MWFKTVLQGSNNSGHSLSAVADWTIDLSTTYNFSGLHSPNFIQVIFNVIVAPRSYRKVPHKNDPIGLSQYWRLRSAQVLDAYLPFQWEWWTWTTLNSILVFVVHGVHRSWEKEHYNWRWMCHHNQSPLRRTRRSLLVDWKKQGTHHFERPWCHPISKIKNSIPCAL